MKTQQVDRPQLHFTRATTPVPRARGRRDDRLMHPAAALLGLACVAGVFALLWLFYTFG